MEGQGAASPAADAAAADENAAATEEEKGKLQTELDAIDEKMPLPLTAIYAVKDDPKQADAVHTCCSRAIICSRSNRWARARSAFCCRKMLPKSRSQSRSRASSSPTGSPIRTNPLTARVMVNRIWQYHFGRGIVSTANDFGRMGGQPSNPELLDYLANQFVEGGWQMKPLHRMILLSSA